MEDFELAPQRLVVVGIQHETGGIPDLDPDDLVADEATERTVQLLHSRFAQWGAGEIVGREQRADGDFSDEGHRVRGVRGRPLGSPFAGLAREDESEQKDRTAGMTRISIQRDSSEL
jgi:hypothetical protein